MYCILYEKIIKLLQVIANNTKHMDTADSYVIDYSNLLQKKYEILYEALGNITVYMTYFYTVF